MCSMGLEYVYTYIYHKFKANVGLYSIHGVYGFWMMINPGYKELIQNGGSKNPTYKKSWPIMHFQGIGS